MLRDLCASGRIHAHIDGDAGFDHQLWAELCAFGLPGIYAPEEYGGSGLEMIDLALAAESLGYFAAPTPFLGHALASMAILRGADEAQKQRWLPALATGKLLGTVALAEAGGGWLPEQWTLPPGAVLHGQKHHVPHALEADLVVVGLSGGRLAVVEKGAPSMRIRRTDGIDRTRTTDLVEFDGTPAVMLAGSEAAARTLVDAGLVLLAADAFGGAMRCVDMAVAYAQTREQFGVAIAQFQALRHQLANMALEAEPGRGLYWYAAHAFDYLPETASHSAALAKAHAVERFLQVARDNIEIHGGVGYTWEYDPHIWLKRAMFDWAWLAPPRQHRARAADLAGW